MRLAPRPRRYVAKRWLALLAPLFGYDQLRDAYVLRGVGKRVGPVLRADRRIGRGEPLEGVDRRRTSLA